MRADAEQARRDAVTNALHASIADQETVYEARVRQTNPVAYWHVQAAREDPLGRLLGRAIFAAVAAGVVLVMGLLSGTSALWLMIPIGLVCLVAAVTRHWVTLVVAVVTLVGLLLESTVDLGGRVRIALGFTLLAAIGAAMLPQRLTDRNRDRREAEARAGMQQATGRSDLWDPSKIPGERVQDWYRDPSRYE
jgi:hypothetical protein